MSKRIYRTERWKRNTPYYRTVDRRLANLLGLPRDRYGVALSPLSVQERKSK